MTVVELLTALLPILSQHLQNPLPWPSLPPLQLRQLRNSRGRRWGSSVMCHEDIYLACGRDGPSSSCFTGLKYSVPLGTSVLPTQRSHHGTEFPNMLLTAPLFLSACPFCFLDSPSSSLGVTPPHPYFLTLYCSQCHCAHPVLLPALVSLPEDRSGGEAGRGNRCSFYHWAWVVVGWEESPWQLTIFTESVFFLHPEAAAGWTSTLL